MKEILDVQGMSCGHCVKRVKDSVSQLAGVNQVNIQLDDAQVEVSFNASQVSLNKIKGTIEETGYEVV